MNGDREMERRIHTATEWKEAVFESLTAGISSGTGVFSILENDLVETGLSTVSGIRLLESFLSGRPGSKIRVLLRVPDMAEAKNPALAEFANNKIGRIEFMSLPPGSSSSMRRLLVLPGCGMFATRFDHQSSEGKVCYDPVETAEWERVFEDAWAEGERLSWTTALGL